MFTLSPHYILVRMEAVAANPVDWRIVDCRSVLSIPETFTCLTLTITPSLSSDGCCRSSPLDRLQSHQKRFYFALI